MNNEELKAARIIEARRPETRDDVDTKSKTYRMAAKNAGTWPKPVRTIPSRPFSKRATGEAN